MLIVSLPKYCCCCFYCASKVPWLGAPRRVFPRVDGAIYHSKSTSRQFFTQKTAVFFLGASSCTTPPPSTRGPIPLYTVSRSSSLLVYLHLAPTLDGGGSKLSWIPISMLRFSVACFWIFLLTKPVSGSMIYFFRIYYQVSQHYFQLNLSGTMDRKILLKLRSLKHGLAVSRMHFPLSSHSWILMEVATNRQSFEWSAAAAIRGTLLPFYKLVKLYTIG